MEQQQAARAVGIISVGFGVAAALAPTRTALAFGVRPYDRGTVALLTRFVGARNLVMGIELLQAEDERQERRALALGLLVGANDIASVLIAVRRRVLGRRAAVVALAALGGVAALGVIALRD